MKASKENSRVLHWKNGSNTSRLTTSQALGPWTFISEKVDSSSQDSQLRPQPNNWTTTESTSSIDAKKEGSIQTITIKQLGPSFKSKTDKKFTNNDLEQEFGIPPQSRRGREKDQKLQPKKFRTKQPP